MKKNIIAVVLTVALIVSFSWSRPAEASWTLWDDFDGNTINTTKWIPFAYSGFNVGLDGSGNLVLSGNGGSSGGLLATLDGSSIKGGAFTYSDYISTNVSSTGAGIYLAVGNPTSGDFYAIERVTVIRPNTTAQNFLVAARYVNGSMVGDPLGFMQYDGNSGGLGIQANKDDNGLDFIYAAYNNGLLESWSSLDSISFAELDHPSVWMGVTAGDNGTTSVNIESVYVRSTPTPTPVPAAVWLLGSGLLGLVGVRRKISK